ncbi:hypothetical protein KY290_025049 [Solanum tuberosum]|uniref:Uncharacterized protein n=1 Tax=Solanum tuberosum TaxID=4113 RepID=A0ABQ7UU97_SOLTU|nr:hypothetical protein KY290_025049 [Solanum tuberosum]
MQVRALAIIVVFEPATVILGGEGEHIASKICPSPSKIGHQCQSTVPTKKDLPNKRRPWKKVTETWQYKGPIQPQEQVCEQNKEAEQIARENSSYITTEKGKNEIEQEQGKQTPGEMSQINMRPNAGGKHLDFNYTDFPILEAIPTRNGFESLMHSKLASLPIDRGGASKTC